MLDVSSDEGEAKNWMLVDAVGGVFSGGMKYFLKHRLAGTEKYEVLGAAEIKGSDAEFAWKIKEDDTEIDYDFDSDDEDFSDDDDEDVGLEIEEERKVKMKWKLSKECHLYSDYEMTHKIGELKVKAKGKYKRKVKETTQFIEYEDEHGSVAHRQEIRHEVKHETKLKKFYYKLEMNGTKLALAVEKFDKKKSFASGANLEWTGKTEEGEELFKIQGEGYDCRIKTNEGADPNATLLAAFACACQFHPIPVQQNAEMKCEGIYLEDD